MTNPYRSALIHTVTHASGPIRLAGWVHRIRDHGGVLFIDLRAHGAIMQCVFDHGSPAAEEGRTLRPETVVSVEGPVRARPAGTENDKLPTGQVELAVQRLDLLGPAGDLPFPVFGEHEYPEDVRLKYRFLDLRRDELRENILKRAAIIRWLRDAMHAADFVEFQTPILTASSPEGARDFLVPSRLHPGEFYALPQAPQQFKQLTMVAGFDRYFQIAPCFRDEAARADRSPGEFYQLDIEMAFVTQEDVFRTVEPIIRGLFARFDAQQRDISVFRRIAYKDALLRYGTDKPDLRNPLFIDDATPVLAMPGMTLAAFKNQTGRTIIVPRLDKPRRWFKEMEGWSQSQGATGLGYITIRVDAEGKRTYEGPLAKFFEDYPLDWLIRQHDLYLGSYDPGDGDTIFFVVGAEGFVTKFAGLLRTKLAEELNLINDTYWAFCWIVDFPMYERNEQTGAIEFSHNPFSMPNFDHDAFMALDPDDHQTILGMTAHQYDLVCNGVELSSGAIRNHRPDVMLKAWSLAGYDTVEVEERFGGMLSAFRCGAPPHGGIAPGIDRMVMLLCGAQNLREVVLYPMNQQGRDLMMGAPSAVSPDQMRELHLRPLPPVKG